MYLSSTCQCVTNNYYDSDYMSCLPLKTYGQTCLESRECNFYNGLVCTQRYCTCPVQQIWGTYYGYNACSRTRQVGETCSKSSDCNGNSYCGLVSGTYRCTCLSTQFYSGFTGQCEWIRKVNERCYNWYQECPTNTTCRQNSVYDGTTFCQCYEGSYYDPYSQSCVVFKTLGQSCNATTNQNSDENVWVTQCSGYAG